MVGVSRLLLCLLVTHYYCCGVVNSISTRIDFEDCGMAKHFDDMIFLKCVLFKGSIVDPYSVDLNSCTKVPCQVEREKFAVFEVVFDPNRKLFSVC